MANIIKSRIWDGKKVRPMEESDYYNRREILRNLGLTTLGVMSAPSLLASCMPSSKSDNNTSVVALDEENCNNCFTFPGMDALYPAERNSRYKLDREMSKEYDATHYNNFYEFIDRSDPNIYNVYKFVAPFDTRDWKIKVSGLCENKGTFDLGDWIKKFGLEERTYRFRCVERWSMAVPWTGFPLSELIKELSPDSKATHIRFVTKADASQMPGVKNLTWYPWPYHEGLRMDEAMNELAFIATGLFGKPLPKQNGAPLRLVVPWKYGYKNIKSITEIEFVSKEPPTFWNTLQAREYPFISNVDPGVPHPRWSQEYETMIPDGEPIKTLKYNGYGDYVGGLY